MYSFDKRTIAKKLRTILCWSLRQIASFLEVSHMTIYRWDKMDPFSFKLCKYPIAKNRIKSSDQVVQALKSILLSKPLILLEDIQKKINDIFSFTISKSFLCSILNRKCGSSFLTAIVGFLVSQFIRKTPHSQT